MTITKTLRLQAFLLLAFLGAVQAVTQTYKPDKPDIEAWQGSQKLNFPSDVECTKGLTLKCKADGYTASPFHKPATHMKFEKDGNDLDAPNPWKEVTKGNGQLNSYDTREKELSKDATTVDQIGEYKCVAARSDQGLNASKPSDGYKIGFKCKGCAKNESCTTHDKYSYCKEDTCACVHFGNYGSCTACHAGTNAGCEDKTPVCNTDGKCVACSRNNPIMTGCVKGETCNSDGSCTSDGGDGGDGDGKSSAGTVTATASVVIASVLVSLMI